MGESVYEFQRGKLLGAFFFFAIGSAFLAHIGLVEDSPLRVRDPNAVGRFIQANALYVAVPGAVIAVLGLIRVLRGPVRVDDVGMFNPRGRTRSLRWVPWERVAEIRVEAMPFSERYRQLVLVLDDGRRSLIHRLRL